MAVEIRAEDRVGEGIEGRLCVFASFVGSHWY
jgi:hypothetical protein